MKRLLMGLGIIIAMGTVGYCAQGAQVQNVGAISTGTWFAMNVSTVPQLIFSTGTNVDIHVAFSFDVNAGTAITPVPGKYLPDRIHWEIFNDSVQDVFIGYNSSVSSMPTSENYGRRITSTAAWSHDCSVLEHWIVSGASTGFRVVVTQER